jgi:coenzyme F420-dependent glucose-6-phosphate dehydrogenase
MSVSFGISPECLCHDVRENVRRVRTLEEAGFEYIWEGDHTLPWHHSSGHSAGIFTTLEAYLNATEQAVVGGMVIPALGLRHHPLDVAIEIATQAVLHPGRVALCVGTGEAMNEKTITGVWPPLKERIGRTIEGIELIRRAWTSEDYFQHKGRYFRSFFYLYTKPEHRIPLLCAAQGPIMARNAGLHADGYVAVGVPPSHHRDVLIPAFEEGASEAGKELESLMKCAWISTFYHPRAQRALDAARIYGGLLIPECYHHIQDPRVIEQRARIVSEEAMREAFCIATSGEEIARVFHEFIAAGCNHIIWADGSPDTTLVARVFEKEVVPLLRRAGA